MAYQFAEFEALIQWVQGRKVTSWKTVEPRLVEAFIAADQALTSGHLSAAEHKKKSELFNDVLVMVARQRTSDDVGARIRNVRGKLFDSIELDICYPYWADPVLVGAETKVAGTPPHRGNHFTERPPNKDIHKRVREVVATSLDLKADWQSGMDEQFTTLAGFVRSSLPAFFSFWAFRTVTDTSHQGLERLMSVLHTDYTDSTGVLYYDESGVLPTSTPVGAALDLMVKAVRQFAH